MERSGPFLGLAGLATVMAVLFGSRTLPVGNPTSRGPASSSGIAASSDRDVSSRSPAPAEEPIGSGADLVEEFIGSSRARIELDVSILILPDPIESHLDWAYDAGLESVRRAFERSRYVADRFWLPWSSPLTPDQRAAAGGRLPQHKRRPGALLFRSAAQGAARLHLVYVVGEVPTAGPHERALRAALNERDILLAMYGRPTPGGVRRDTLRIIGPIFSGSIPSLRLALDEWLARHPTGVAHVVSGGATNDDNVARMTTGAPRIAYSATVNPSAALAGALDEYLSAVGIARHEVALLRETTTLYGQNTLAPARGGTQLVIPFPMNISSLRREYARHADPSERPVLGPAPAARLPLDLAEAGLRSETPPVMSDLTVPAQDLVLDEIARTLIAHKIRVVGILATDVRDKLFLATEVRKRVRDVQIYTYGSNTLYARPDRSRWLRGMIVVSTYPLFLESQYWDSTQASRHRLVFTSDLAEGVYNATLAQLGEDALMLDYSTPFSKTSRSPPVWITAVGRGAVHPVTLAATVDASSGEAHLRQRRLPVIAGDPSELQDFATEFLLLGALLSIGFLLTVRGLQRRMERRLGHTSGHVDPTAVAAARATTEGADDAGLASPGRRGAPAATFDRQRRTAEQVSLRLQAELYVVLRLFALCGMLVPAVLVLFRARAHGVRLSAFLYAPFLALLPALVVGVVFVSCARRFWIVWREQGRPAVRRGFRREADDRSARRNWAVDNIARIALLAAGAMYLALVFAFAFDVLALDDTRSALYFERMVAVWSGVTPATPLILIGAILALWCTWQLKRIELLFSTTAFEEAYVSHEGERPSRTAGHFNPESDDIAEHAPAGHAGRGRRALAYGQAVRAVRERLLFMIPTQEGYVLLIVFGLLSLWLWPQFASSMEAAILPAAPIPGVQLTLFDVLFRLGIFTALLLTVWSLYRFLKVWASLRDVLRELAGQPLLPAFRRLPEPVGRLTRFTPFEEPAEQIVDAAVSDRWRMLRSIYVSAEPAFAATGLRPVSWLMEHHRQPRLRIAAERGASLRGEYRAISRALTAAWRDAQCETDEVRADARLVGQPPDDHAVALRSGAAAVAVADEPAVGLSGDGDTIGVHGGHSGSTNGSANGGPNGAASLAGPHSGAASGTRGARQRWLAVAEECAAMYVVEYIDWVMRFLRYLAVFLLLSLVLTTILLASYPFQPQTLVRVLLFVVLATTVGAITVVLAQMNRDPVLSNIAKTDAGRISWDGPFWLNLMVFAAIPLLTFIGTEFPGLRDFFLSWLTPLLHAFGKG